jgi:hypothetical protein
MTADATNIAADAHRTIRLSARGLSLLPVR